MKLIKTPAQKRWVQDMFARGFQAVVNAAYGDTALRRAYHYVAKLEDADVIRQWHVLDPDGDVYDLVDPSGAPLFIAGERWDDFVAEARKLGLAEVSP
jgi:hypothetical protein